MNSFVFLIAVISVIFAGAFSGSVPFTDCGSADAKIISVGVSNCTAFPCPLKKGENTTVTMVFTPSKNMTGVSTSAYGYIGPIKTPYPLNDNNACHFMTCPLVAGTNVTYTTQVFVQPAYPTLTLQIEWQLHDTADDAMLTCFLITGKIVN